MKEMHDKLITTIERVIKEEAETIFEKHKQEMIKDLDERKDQIIAGICINIMEHVRIQDFGNTLQIEVKTEKLG